MATPDPPAAEQHADTCDGTCPRWKGSGLPTCIEACVCATTKANVPDFVKQRGGEIRCWWRKKTGGVTSRCDCWGSTRDGKPGDCCAHHSANPRYLLTTDGMLADPGAALAAAAEVPEERDERPADADSVMWDDGEAYAPLRVERKPYVRRWPAETLTCPHRLPPKGIHCQECHEVYATDMAYGMHKPSWTAPCRDPEDIADIDTGAALLARNTDGSWRMRWWIAPGTLA